MTLRPRGHFVQRGPQRSTKRRQAVVHVPVRVTDHNPMHQAIAFELAQLLAEHFVSDTRHRSLQIVEPPWPAASQQPEDQRFPLAADDVDRQLHRAGVCVLSERGHSSVPFDANAPGGALTHVQWRSLIGLEAAIHSLDEGIRAMSTNRKTGTRVAAGLSIALTMLAISSSATSTQSAKPARVPRFEHVIDLTHTLDEDTPYIPVPNITFPFKKIPIATVAKDHVAAYRWEIHEHLGTQIDAPNHFFDGGLSLDRLPADSLVVPLVVIDVSARVATNPDTSLTVADIEAWERQHGRIADRAAVMMASGWDSRIKDAKAFVNADASGAMHFPGVSQEAATFLARAREVSGIGVDTLSLDPGLDVTYAAHKAWLATGKWGVELVANLKEVPPVGALVFVGAAKVKGATGGPVRLIAVW